MNFKPGDRVRYSRPNTYSTVFAFMIGQEGTVIECRNLSGLTIKWDTPTDHRQKDEGFTWAKDRFDLIGEEKAMLKVGDVGIYNVANGAGMTHLNGKTGVVIDLSSTGVQLRWDHSGSTYWADKENVTRYSPAAAEIDRALATLKAAGDVTFKPRKPSFNPIHVTLNSQHNAIVTQGGVTVGCQHFTFGVIEQVWDAVQKAKDYARS